MTKKQYNKQKNELLKKLEAIQARIDEKIKADEMETIDSVYDEEYETEREIRFLDNAWETRNWTGAEWSTYELMCSNID